MGFREAVTRRIARWMGKSLYDLHPELLDRQPLLRMNSEDEQASSNVSGFTQSAGYYSTHMWLQKAVAILANNIAPLPLRVARGPQEDTEYPSNHIVNSLLDNPNPEMSPEDLWKQWVTDQMLGGEFGLEAAKNQSKTKILELWPRQPQTFTVKPASVRYRKVQFYKIDDGNGDPYPLTPEEFAHFKFYNPLQPFRGLTPVGAIRFSILIDQMAQAWTRLLFKNNQRPDFAVVAPEGITPTEKKEILKQLETEHGFEHAHKPIVLEEGVTDIKTFSFPPKDTEWLAQRQMNRDEVAAIIGVPDEIMGYGRDTYENFSTAEKVLWTLTIVPLCGLRDGTLTRFFRRIGMLRPDERIETNFTNVPQLQEDKSGKITQMKDLFSMGVPVNTASDYVNAGLPPVKGGEVGYLPIGLVPVGTSLALRTPTATPEPEKSFKHKGVLEWGSAEHEATYKALQDRIERPVAELKRIVKREFQRQQNDINRKLRGDKTFGRGLFKDSDSVPSPQSLFDLQAEIDKFIKAIEDSVFETVENIGNAELIGLGLQGTFDINRPEVQAAVKHILNTVATKTNETTWNGLIDLFQEAEDAGEGIPEIMERLSTYFGDRKSDYQTERIARTTMTGASNDGAFQAWNQSGIVKGKTWISALQMDRTRDAHAAAHGQTVGLNEMFTVDGESLQYPGDPTGSPSNIINCLCSMIAVVEE
jgi:HK97 family phage portal protein